jgi:hypothetical protein
MLFLKVPTTFSGTCVYAVLCAIGLLGSCPSQAQDAKDFMLTVDGQALSINAGETVIAKTRDGAEVQIRLARRPFSAFRGSRLTFEYPSGLSVASTAIEKDVQQHVLTTATGSVIIVQEYATIDPSPFVQLVLNRVAKDDVATGGKLTTEPAIRALPSQEQLIGLKAKISKKDEAVALEVVTIGKARQGVMIITRIASDNAAADQPVIDRLWSSLKLIPVAE